MFAVVQVRKPIKEDHNVTEACFVLIDTFKLKYQARDARNNMEDPENYIIIKVY